MARLYCKNRGDFQVTAWDDFAEGLPYYDGKYGLTGEEAADLIELGHYLQGLIDAHDKAHQFEVGDMITGEILKHRRWCPGLYDNDDLQET